MSDNPCSESPAKTSACQRRRHLLLLVVIFYFIFAGAGAQQLYLVPYLQQVTPWSSLSCVVLLAVVYTTMMVFRVGNVHLLQSWPDWKWTAVGTVTYFLFPAGMFVVAYLPSYWLALGFAVLWGWGAATLWGGTTMQTLALTEGRKDRYGTGMGLLYAGTHAGWFSGVIILGLVFARYNTHPQLTYLVAAGITLVALLLLFGLPQSTEATIAPPSGTRLRRIIAQPKAIISMFLLGSSALAFGLMLGTFADYVKAQYGAEYVWITGMFYPGILIGLSFVSGWLSDLGGRAPVLSASFILAAAGCALAVLWHSPIALATAAAFWGLLNGAVPVISAALVGDSAERRRRPLAYGALFASRDLGAVLGLVGSRLAAGDGANLQTSFTSFGILFVFCAGIAVLLQRYAQQRL